MKLSTRSRYGTRILLELALHPHDEPVQVGQIAGLQKISVKYVEQLIRTLQKARLIKSLRGSKGGHQLSKPPSQITVGQIVRLFEGQTDLVECVSAPDKCRQSAQCRVRRVWVEATQAMYDKLDSVTIADLVEEERCPAVQKM